MFVKLITLSLFCLNSVLAQNFTSNCGRSKAASPVWRIVGGSAAAPGEFPWQILLTRAYTNGLGQNMMEMCGGSIISDRWMLTAAHCVAQSSVASQYSVYLGVHNIANMREQGNEARAQVEKVIHHEHFNALLVQNDIALVKIVGSIDFAGKYKNLEPVCLATSALPNEAKCVATGFGMRAASGIKATTLQKVTEPVVDNSHCLSVHRNYNSLMSICAGGDRFGGSGTCMGDSGGPLQCKNTDGRYYQVGITSYGVPCAKPNDPDVFTNVAHYIDWIKTTIARN